MFELIGISVVLMFGSFLISVYWSNRGMTTDEIILKGYKKSLRKVIRSHKSNTGGGWQSLADRDMRTIENLHRKIKDLEKKGLN